MFRNERVKQGVGGFGGKGNGMETTQRHVERCCALSRAAIKHLCRPFHRTPSDGNEEHSSMAVRLNTNSYKLLADFFLIPQGIKPKSGYMALYDFMICHRYVITLKHKRYNIQYYEFPS